MKEQEQLISAKITGLKNLVIITDGFEEYNAKTRDAINKVVNDIILVHGSGDWVGYTLTHCKKSELLEKMRSVMKRMIEENQIKLDELIAKRKLAEAKAEADKHDIKKEVEHAIDCGKANFLGEGDWVKDSAYQVYEYEGRYFTVIVYDNTSKWLMAETITEIKEEEISQYF
jgi:hypothetical protein